MTDFQRAFEPDAPRELAETVNKMCAEAEGIGFLIHRIESAGRRGETYEYYCYNPLADYVGDMNNIFGANRIRDKAIAANGVKYVDVLYSLKLDGIAPADMVVGTAPPWAMLKAAYEVLKGKEDGK